jgi:hypothetical protein
MTWQPTQIIADASESEPSKPSKPGSVGFDGSASGQSPEIPAVAEAFAGATELVRAEPLEFLLKHRAIELWSETAGRVFLVADDEDAHRAAVRLGVQRGDFYTVAEMRRIVSVRDPPAVAEIHAWKRRFGGILRG